MVQQKCLRSCLVSNMSGKDFTMADLIREEPVPMKKEAYYSREWKCWVAVLKDQNGNQIGDAGTGPTKAKALADLVD